jgi:hypothetical protein
MLTIDVENGRQWVDRDNNMVVQDYPPCPLVPVVTARNASVGDRQELEEGKTRL